MSGICSKLHILFNSLPRFTFPFDENRIPQNGLYVLFEKGELGHGMDRIVRVGTHTGNGQLRSRLRQHFVNENKDRSIFRKNIGRALLNKTGDPFLAQWNIDLTTGAAKLKFSGQIDMERQKHVEERVSTYIRTNFSFVVVGVGAKEERLRLESEIISAVSLCNECGPSQAWLGLCSPLAKIRESGLWLVNELYKKPIGEEGFGRLSELAEGEQAQQ